MEVGFKYLIACSDGLDGLDHNIVVVLGLHSFTVGVVGVVRELSAIIESHEKLTFVKIVASKEDVC